MSGTVTLTRKADNVETQHKVTIESHDDADAVRGFSATEAQFVFIGLKTRFDFDVALHALRIARECMADE